MAAVTAAVLILTLEPFFGTDTKTAPSRRSSSRACWLKLKIVLAPSRAIVRSAKVNSVRESVPVRTAVPMLTSSFTDAGRAAACWESNRTSLIIWVTRADDNSAAVVAEGTVGRQTKTKIKKRLQEVAALVRRDFIFLARNICCAIFRRRFARTWAWIWQIGRAHV